MPLSWIAATLESLQQKGLLRSLRTLGAPPGPYVEIEGRRFLNLASNNYLDLAGHPRVKAAVSEAVAKWGWGAGASALVSGHTTLHEDLCRRLAGLKGAPEAVLFPTGFQANLGTIGALAGAGDLIVIDRLCHASIVDGARLSGAAVRAYPHNNIEKLAKILGEPHGGRTLVVTERVFSMDGDLAPLESIAAACAPHRAMLMVDEAHATGVLAASSARAVGEPQPEAVIRMGTLSKALGGIGGFVAGSHELAELLRNRARALIYTTSLPPAAAAGALAALAVIRDEPWRREAVLARARQLRAALRASGLSVPDGSAAIVPVMIGDAEAALRVAAELLDEGILAPAIRPPTVPRGTSRLRLSLMATHSQEDMTRVAEAIASKAVAVSAADFLT